MKVVAFCLISLVVVVIWHEALEHSGYFVIKFFEDYWYTALDWFFGAFAEVTGYMFFWFGDYVYLFDSRRAGVMLSAGGCLSAAITGMLKLTLRHPRPFWKYNDLASESCIRNMGTPSGHTFFSGAPAFIILKMYRRSYITVLMLSYLLVLSFDRVYLGVHFLHQVVLGLILAYGISEFLISEWVHSLLIRIKTEKKSLILVNLFLISLFAVAILLYSFVNLKIPGEWSVNFKTHCGTSLTAKASSAGNVRRTPFVMILAGVVTGYSLADDKPSELSLKNMAFAGMFTFAVFYYIPFTESIFSDNLPPCLALICIGANMYLLGFFKSYYLPKLIQQANK